MADADGERGDFIKKNKVVHVLLSKKELGAVLPLVALLVIVSIGNPNFFAVQNILDVLRTASFSFIVAVPVTFLLSSGGMDLSIGAATSFGGVICAFGIKAGLPIPAAIILAVLSGAVIGTFNGYIIVYHDLPAFIVTLGTQYVVNGIIAVTTGNLAISGFSNEFKAIGQGKLFGSIPLPVIYAVLIGLIGHTVLMKMKYGREILAIGGNKETAFLSGIPVRFRRLTVFMATSSVAALAGVLMASRFAGAQPVKPM